MKELLFAFAILITTTFAAKAQTPPLNKQQTIDYIDNLYKNTYRSNNDIVKIESVTMDNKILIVKYNDGSKFRNDLGKVISLNIKESSYNNRYNIYDNNNVNILGGIQLESDANRLKKALEHLVELVKAEKSTDPFDN